MSKKHHILIVEDEPSVATFIELLLRKQGYVASVRMDGKTARKAVDEESIDLVILDLTLPDEDGLDVARYIREKSTIPIIMVTARADPVDRVIGLELGADDYLPKPFEPRELLARVKSVLRRAVVQKQENDKVPDRTTLVASFDRWQLDFGSRQLITDTNETIHLTTAQFDLLSLFVKNPNRILNRDLLLDRTRNREAQPYDRSIDVHVMHLRKKVERDPRNPEIIKTVHGSGYVFATNVTWL